MWYNDGCNNDLTDSDRGKSWRVQLEIYGTHLNKMARVFKTVLACTHVSRSCHFPESHDSLFVEVSF
jgi:hypothetical protein